MKVSNVVGMDTSSRGMCHAGPLHCQSCRHMFSLRRVWRPAMRMPVRAAVEEQDRGEGCLLLRKFVCNCPAVDDHAAHSLTHRRR